MIKEKACKRVSLLFISIRAAKFFSYNNNNYLFLSYEEDKN